ncbi:MAG: LPS export ABC transporter periplasmic protein LptC [Chitinophagaceae bacterium]|jgi:LPS export ABC transporter protein LptC
MYIKNFKHFLVLALSVSFFASCENDEAAVKSFDMKELGVEEGKNIVTFLSTNGKTKGKLTAPYMVRNIYDSNKVEFPKTVQVDFYDSALNVESHLFAKYGKYLENDNTIYLRDSVIVFNVKQDTLFTNELWWDQNQNVFYTNKPVILANNNAGYAQKLCGMGGFRSNQDFSFTSFYKVGKAYNPNINNFLLLKDTANFY